MILEIVAICFIIAVVCIASSIGYLVWSMFVMSFWLGLFTLGIALLLLARFLAFFADEKNKQKDMKCKQYCQKLKEALSEIKNEAQYVGEDGGMVTDCGSKREALRRFKQLERECNGEEEAKQIKSEDIITAYFHLAEETTKENREGMNIEEDGWYIDIKAPSPVKVWYYTA